MTVFPTSAVLALAVALSGIVLSTTGGPIRAQQAKDAGADNTGESTTNAEEAPKATEEKPLDGEVLFATSCGWCHQDGGRVAGRGPKLAGSKRSDEFILQRIIIGKPGAMPQFGQAFTAEQLNAILAYIRSLPDNS
jgi:mono/diheme cytochrome c family protein